MVDDDDDDSYNDNNNDDDDEYMYEKSLRRSVLLTWVSTYYDDIGCSKDNGRDDKDDDCE